MAYPWDSQKEQNFTCMTAKAHRSFQICWHHIQQQQDKAVLLSCVGVENLSVCKHRFISLWLRSSTLHPHTQDYAMSISWNVAKKWMQLLVKNVRYSIQFGSQSAFGLSSTDSCMPHMLPLTPFGARKIPPKTRCTHKMTVPRLESCVCVPRVESYLTESACLESLFARRDSRSIHVVLGRSSSFWDTYVTLLFYQLQEGQNRD